MTRLVFGEIDLSHSRLTELAKLADQAKPFHDWVTSQFQKLLKSHGSLTQMLMESTEEEILKGIAKLASHESAPPLVTPITSLGHLLNFRFVTASASFSPSVIQTVLAHCSRSRL